MRSERKIDHSMAVVVNTCDSYHDVLDVFFYAFQEYWPDCPFSVIINTESNQRSYPARTHNYVNSTKEDDWGARLLSTLNSIDTEFVLMVYDDFILDAPISNQRVDSALQLMRSKPTASVTYLMNTRLPSDESDTDEIFVKIKDKVDYRLNSAPAIWRRQDLINYTAPGDTPWAWEVFGTYKTWGDGKLFYSLNPKQKDIYHYNHLKGGAIYRGKWVRDVVDQITRKYPLKIDWTQRGFSSDTTFEKRSFMWKIRFMQTGFRMVGFKALNFFTGYIRNKIHARR